jgi:hypothetical protein
MANLALICDSIQDHGLLTRAMGLEDESHPAAIEREHAFGGRGGVVILGRETQLSGV